MTNRRMLLKCALALAAMPLASLAQVRPHLVMYRSPGCGCCGGWEAHMRAAGFRVESRMLENLAAVRRELGMPDSLASCHTAVLGGYVVEGHVPAADVQRLLRERPRAIGLAAPGMPADAPGMDQRRGEPYEVLAFDSRRSWLFARH